MKASILLYLVVLCCELSIDTYPREGKQPKRGEETPSISNNYVGTTYKNVRVVSVYDGDTFKVDLPCNEPLLCNKISIRIRGIDTPEIRGKCEKEKILAKQAKSMLNSMLVNGNVNLIDCERGKYFRLVCSVQANGIDVPRTMIEKGYAREYTGKGKRKSWCN